MPSTECRIPNTDYRISNTEYRIPNTECRVPNTKYRVPNTEYRAPRTEYRVTPKKQEIHQFLLKQDIHQEIGISNIAHYRVVEVKCKDISRYIFMQMTAGQLLVIINFHRPYLYTQDCTRFVKNFRPSDHQSESRPGTRLNSPKA